MNTLQLKTTRMWLLEAKKNQDVAQADYDSEVRLLKEYEKQLMDAFNANMGIEGFLAIREMKRLQTKIVRESHHRLTLAMHAVDLAETEYDMAFASAAIAADDAAASAAAHPHPATATTSR